MLKFDKNVSVDTVIQGEMLLAKANYYQTTDFTEIEGKTRFNSEELNAMLEQSRGYLTNIQLAKIPNDCQGVFFVQDSMKKLNELSPLAKYNLKKVVTNNTYLPETDKVALSEKIDDIRKNQSKELEQQELESTNIHVKIFQFAKSINRLLGGNPPPKNRNLDKLIKQTKKNKKRMIGFYQDR